MLKQFKRTFLFLLAGIVLLTQLPMLPASAVSYSGRGTRSNPYLVQTAEQLQGMQNNLTAHYKLANTIDLKGRVFKPIGFLANPFSGSFVCDTDADGTPKYAIKNLSVSVEGKAGYLDYSSQNSRWEAALFGATDGATLTNIAVLDVSIKNTVIGKNKMNADYSLNPGQDEMACGGLVGIAQNSKITGCMASGTIDSSTNHNGGMIGRALDTSVENCYSTVQVKGTGAWCQGGLVGSAQGLKADNCYAAGSVQASCETAGGFLGSTDTTSNATIITNCYAVGTLSRTTASFCGRFEITDQFINCLALGKSEGYNKAPDTASTDANNFVLNSVGYRQPGFAPATAAQIKTAYASLADWDTSGTYPTLKTVKTITEFSKYVPGAVTQIPNGIEQDISQPEDGNASAPSEPQQAMSTDEFTAAVDALPVADDLPEEDAWQVLELREQLSSITDEAVVSKYTVVLNAYYDTACKTLLKAITEAIEALPEPEEITAGDADTVLAVYEKYNKLPETYRNFIQDTLVEKLNACYEKVQAPADGTIIEQEIETAMTRGETVAIVVLSVFSLAALCATALMIVKSCMLIKKLKTENGEPDENA